MLTITEALAEIKTITKRLEKKKVAVSMFLVRDSRLKDSLEAEGGSVEYVKRERQAIADLEKRIISIRTAIQKSNLETTTTVGDTAMTVAEWLTFRREVSAGRKQFLVDLAGIVRNVRDKIQREGIKSASPSTTGETVNRPVEVIVNLDEKMLLEEQESLEKTLGDLDGRLSLLNATTVIAV